MPPRATVVVPVYNRRDELRAALGSLEDQTFSDFECLVIDDASTTPIEDIVEGLDDRFRYVRLDRNRGCTGARFAGYERTTGEYLLQLDSDNVFFPWALDRAIHFLDHNPGVGGVAGLYVFEDGLRLRVSGGTRIVTPDEWKAGAVKVGSDCVGAVRRAVVEDWLNGIPADFFNADFLLWMKFHLGHSMLFVDEPWGKYDSSGADRVSVVTNERSFPDALRSAAFACELAGTEACVPLDEFLRGRWRYLSRNGEKDNAAVVAGYLAERGISTRSIMQAKLKARLVRSRRRAVAVI